MCIHWLPPPPHFFFLNFGSCFIPQAEVSSLGFVLSVKFFAFSEALWGLTIQYLKPPALISNGRVRILLLCMRIIFVNICVSLLPELIEISMSSLIFCGASMLHTSLAAILYSCQEKVISYNVNDMVFESISFLFFPYAILIAFLLLKRAEEALKFMKFPSIS